MSLTVLSYNIKRVMNIIGVKKMIAGSELKKIETIFLTSSAS
jgi:hypothetical protein